MTKTRSSVKNLNVPSLYEAQGTIVNYSYSCLDPALWIKVFRQKHMLDIDCCTKNKPLLIPISVLLGCISTSSLFYSSLNYKVTGHLSTVSFSFKEVQLTHSNAVFLSNFVIVDHLGAVCL